MSNETAFICMSVQHFLLLFS